MAEYYIASCVFTSQFPELSLRIQNYVNCRQFGSDKVVCYCHYCYEGLQIGGADASHLAQLLFAED